MSEQTEITKEELQRLLLYVQMNQPKPNASAVMAKLTFAGSLVKYVWVAGVFLVMGGASFVHFQSALVRIDDFKPIQEAFRHQLPLMAKKLERLESGSKGAEKAVTKIQTQLTIMTSTLGRIDSSQSRLHKQSSVMALCSMHRDNYVAQLADYAAGVRKIVPTRSEGYKKCMSVLTTKVHGG